MSLPSGEQPVVMTEHALLVAYGRFAQQIGVLNELRQVPFKMKTVRHSPADKVTELLCHLLAGGMHISELGHSAHPLTADHAVARAWGQQRFASASGVSQVLQHVSDETVTALRHALTRVLAPYRRRLLGKLAAAGLVVDFDLTGLVLSDQATSYEGAEFGHLGRGSGASAIARGHQFARAQVVGETDAFVLGGFLHPGRTVAVHCVTELVALTEAQLGRPRRRVEALDARLAAAAQQLAVLDAAVAHRTARGRTGPRAQRQVQRRDQHQQALADLRVRRETLAAENAANPTPRRILLRLDGAFGNARDLTWLYEQGYSVVARAQAHRVAEALRQEAGLRWEKGSKNLFIAEGTRRQLGDCPYQLRLLVCRQWWGEQHQERFSTLVVTPDLAPQPWPVRRLGVFYNGRQVIEAGIKESKGIFASRHLPPRHQAGIALYQDLVLFAQNLIRWFRRQFLARSPLAAASIKELVRIGANSRALLCQHHGVTILTFATDSPWAGLTVPLRSQLGHQLWFSFLEDYFLARAGP